MVGRWGGPTMPGEEELVCGAGAGGVDQVLPCWWAMSGEG